MKKLCLAPAAEDKAKASADTVQLEPPQEGAALGLWMGKDGALAASPVTKGKGRKLARRAGRRDLIAMLRPSGLQSWYFVPVRDDVGVNGLMPPLPITLLTAGTLLSIGCRFWMVTWLWTPMAVSVPDEIRDKLCPVCGGELALAHCVECECGRWVHWGNPDDSDDPEALNCYLEAPECGDCGLRTGLDAQLIPEVPEKLALRSDEAEAWDP